MLNSNTTNVKVKRSRNLTKQMLLIYSNTTNVKVKLSSIVETAKPDYHSNTTNVKVKRINPCRGRNAFKIQIQPMLRLNK